MASASHVPPRPSCLPGHSCQGCSQPLLPFQVEAVIHHRFLAELLSPEPELDLSGLAEELQQEEGLSPEEVARGGTDTRETGGRGEAR